MSSLAQSSEYFSPHLKKYTWQDRMFSRLLSRFRDTSLFKTHHIGNGSGWPLSHGLGKQTNCSKKQSKHMRMALACAAAKETYRQLLYGRFNNITSKDRIRNSDLERPFKTLNDFAVTVKKSRGVDGMTESGLL
jgi:hypothetical protein